MKTIKIKNVGTIKLNSFRPLCVNLLGINAINKYNYPPFIDSSCRREPDFENFHPSISSLCRGGSFAPHLKIGDIVVYMTKKGVYQYPPNLEKVKTRRLVAILQVIEVYPTHQCGELGYKNQNLNIPNNCMVIGNNPKDFDQTAGDFKSLKGLKSFMSHTNNVMQSIGKRRINLWDNKYWNRANTWKCFVETIPIYNNPHSPKIISDTDLISIFGKIPNTRTPNKITQDNLVKLVDLDIIIN